jgi:TolB-like protein
VWRGRLVSDEVLSRNISVLRSQLGDNARDPDFIETIPTAGYRFLASVRPLEVEGTSSDSRRPWYLAGAGFILAATLAALFWLTTTSEPTPLPTSTVAVLPFQDLSDAAGSDYFSEGLTDELLVALGRAEGLRVVARTSSYAFKDRDVDVRVIGTTLGAGSILEGNVRRDGPALRVSARLIDANSGMQLWSETFDASLEEVFEVQNDISQAIADKLAATLVPSLRPTDNFEAYRTFLRAHYQLRRRGLVPIQRSIELFGQAIDMDPEFGRAYVGLASAYTIRPGYTGEDEDPSLALALTALDKAEQLGESGSLLLGTRAEIYYRQWRWHEAATAFGGALALAPDDAEITNWYSSFLANIGDMQGSFDAAARAVKLDPLSAVAHQRLAVVNIWAGDMDAAADHFAIANELGLGPLATPEAYVALLLRSGEFDQVIERLTFVQAARGLDTNWLVPTVTAIRESSDASDAVRLLAAAYETQQIGPRLYVGGLYFLGETEAFFDGLMTVIDRHQPIDTELLFTDTGAHLRKSPRFLDAMERIGLVAYWDAEGWPEVLEGGDNDNRS